MEMRLGMEMRLEMEIRLGMEMRLGMDRTRDGNETLTCATELNTRTEMPCTHCEAVSLGQ